MADFEEEVSDDLELDEQPVDDPLEESPGGESKPAPESDDAGAGHDDDDDKQYSARVQKRIGREVYRRKQAEENVGRLSTAVESLRAELEQIKSRNAAADAQAAEGTLQGKLHSAKQRLRQAILDQDDEVAATATEEIADARAEMREMAARQAWQREQQGRQQQTDTQQPQIPETMGKWLKENSWYQSGQNPRAARLAAELFEDIRQDGFDPNDADTYTELNKRIRAAMPRAAEMIKDIHAQSPVRRRESGPPTGISSVDGKTTAPAKRTLTNADLDAMTQYGLDRNNPEHRKAWLRNHS